MPRVKRGTIHQKKRRRILKKTKGYRGGQKSKIRAAKTAILRAGAYAYRDRRNKKRQARQLWQLKINAACRLNDLTYARFINGLKKNKIDLDRKILALLAEKHPQTFTKIVEMVR
jgi:large subunit ribosomal protein L20